MMNDAGHMMHAPPTQQGIQLYGRALSPSAAIHQHNYLIATPTGGFPSQADSRYADLAYACGGYPPPQSFARCGSGYIIDKNTPPSYPQLQCDYPSNVTEDVKPCVTASSAFTVAPASVYSPHPPSTNGGVGIQSQFSAFSAFPHSDQHVTPPSPHHSPVM